MITKREKAVHRAPQWGPTGTFQITDKIKDEEDNKRTGAGTCGIP
jgi:hypothetical protein